MEFCNARTVSVSLLLLLLQTFSPVRTQLHDSGQQSDCTTPESKAGRCIELGTCAELMQLLSSSNTTGYERLRQSSCRTVGQDPWVCCPIRGSVSVKNSNSLTSKEQEPSNNCGDLIEYRPWVGTSPFEFPWLTLLEYTKTQQGNTTACGGVLISKRYVLTAAHCVTEEDLPQGWRLNNVRLGEYDLSKERNCLRNTNDTKDFFCVDDPVSVDIEEKIVHEDYRPGSQNKANDIAILKLAQDVTFSEYIKPICLSLNNKTVNNFFHIAGWGKTKTRSESNVKSNRTVVLADFKTCADTYRQSQIPLGDGQLCVGSRGPRDLCYGDSGGPLMSQQLSVDGRILWVVYGIDSFGPLPCEKENLPGVYTNVTKYIPWILSKMKR